MRDALDQPSGFKALKDGPETRRPLPIRIVAAEAPQITMFCERVLGLVGIVSTRVTSPIPIGDITK